MAGEGTPQRNAAPKTRWRGGRGESKHPLMEFVASSEPFPLDQDSKACDEPPMGVSTIKRPCPPHKARTKQAEREGYLRWCGSRDPDKAWRAMRAVRCDPIHLWGRIEGGVSAHGASALVRKARPEQCVKMEMPASRVSTMRRVQASSNDTKSSHLRKEEGQAG